jgi:hypothetical protein
MSSDKEVFGVFLHRQKRGMVFFFSAERAARVPALVFFFSAGGAT